VRLVLDTDVVVAAMRSPGGASAELIRRIDRGRATLLLSVSLVLEYEAVCVLAVHRQAGALGLDEVLLFLDELVTMSEKVLVRFQWRPQVRDPGDEMVLEAAINGAADAIVTFNLRDYAAGPGRFGIEVLRPGEVLRRVSA